ncbi:MAG: N-acetylmuramoyl-L-alanine amidase [Clostridia bacterium]|nr:N-acetylmuramoyl-L-alanine amidase [Clostridia bacterium]
MFITLKKKSVAIAIVLIVAVVAISVGCAFVAENAARATMVKTNGMTVVIDAGHGGIDGGVVGSTGVKESDINLKMAGILQKEIESRGFRVVLTRTGKDALNNIKRLDMQARKEIIVKAAPVAVISLHVNRFSDKSRRGAQVFYDDTGIGKEFAESMQKTINEKINAKYSGRDDYEAIDGDLFITKCVKVPSVIIECGFISNPEDEKLLLSREYCQELCKNIADVLCERTCV